MADRVRLPRSGSGQRASLDTDSGRPRPVWANAGALGSVTMQTKQGCPFCAKAKSLLREAHMPYEEVELSHGVTTRTLNAVAGASSTPQVFIGGHKVGGSEELEAWLKRSGASRPVTRDRTDARLGETSNVQPTLNAELAEK